MNDLSDSLYDAFNGKENEFTYSFGKSLAGETFDAMKKSYSEKSASLSWPGLSKEIQAGAGDLLKVSLPDILIRAWNKAGILNKYINKEKYDPAEVFLIELEEHTITSKHKPYLDIEVNNTSIGRINFDIELKLKVQGIILKIQDAKIKQLRTGVLKLSGSISCAGLEIAKKKDKEINLPGKIDFGKGIPIAP